MRNRNCGLTSSRSSACWMPRSKLALGAARLVERQQIRDVGVGRPGGGRRGARACDRMRVARTAASSAGRSRTADEDAPAARRVAGPVDVVRPADRHHRDRRLRAAAARARPQRRLVARLGALDERDADQVRAGLQRQAGIRAAVRGAPPRRGLPRPPRPPPAPPTRLQLHALAVDADLELRAARAAPPASSTLTT